MSAPIDDLTTLCRSARRELRAAAVSVALTHDDHLEYVAADGAGAAGIVGVTMPVTRGVAGFVAATGQSLSIDVAQDARFARDIAEGTGYVPSRMLVAPVTGPDGDVTAVLSVLDADDTADRPPLRTAARFAGEAANAVGALRAERAADGADASDDALVRALAALTPERRRATIDAAERLAGPDPDDPRPGRRFRR